VKPTVPQLRQLIGNPRAYAVQNADGSYTPVRLPLTPRMLRLHLAGSVTLGTYINRGARARTLVFDVDSGDEDEAANIITALRELGLPFEYVGLEYSGRKGYHVWVVASTYMPARTLRRIGLAVRDEVGLPKLEVFPKQDEAVDLGNLVKLPGGIHRVTGKVNDFVSPFPKRVPQAKLEELAAKCPDLRAAGGERVNAPGAVPYPCIGHTMDEGTEPGSRNNSLFQLAVMLRRAGVTDHYVRSLVRDVNQRSAEPLDGLEVEALLNSSQSAGPICSALPEDRHCGEKCILTKTAGLHTRANYARFAAPGEHVVLEVTSHDDGVINFRHPDLAQARGIVAPQEKNRGD
jgi:hypothetical protein